MQRLEEINFLLWWLGFGVFFTLIFPYLIFGFYFQPWIISIPDMIDLVLYPPIIGLVLYFLFEKLGGNEAPYGLRYIYILFLIIHFVGHGFHWSANAIHETLKHVEGSISADALAYVYFLDEILSHKIMYYSFYAMLLTLLVIDIKYSDISGRVDGLTMLSAILFGFSVMVSAIEGQSPFEAISMGIVVMLLIVLTTKDRGTGFLKRKPLMFFMLLANIVLLTIAGAYWVVFGGFLEPSKVLK